MTHGRHDPELNAEIIRLWNEGGGSARQIGRQVGRSRNAIIGVIKRARDRGIDMKDHATGAQKQNGGRPRTRPIPVERVVPVVATDPVPMLQRQAAQQCCWPLWPDAETGAPDFIVCGGAKSAEHPYCDGHRAVAAGREGTPWKPGEGDRRVIRKGTFVRDLVTSYEREAAE